MGSPFSKSLKYSPDRLRMTGDEKLSAEPVRYNMNARLIGIGEHFQLLYLFHIFQPNLSVTGMRDVKNLVKSPQKLMIRL